MSSHKTRCPYCESAFAVSEEQLAARGGHVRCGKCFQVFKADQYLLDKDSDVALVDNTAPKTAPVVKSSQPRVEARVNTIDDAVFDLLDEPAATSNEAPTLAGIPAIAEPTSKPTPTDTSEVVPPVPALSGASAAPAIQTPPVQALGNLDDEERLGEEFDELFSQMSPREIDLDQGYGRGALLSQASVPALQPNQLPPVERPLTQAPMEVLAASSRINIPIVPPSVRSTVPSQAGQPSLSAKSTSTTHESIVRTPKVPASLSPARSGGGLSLGEEISDMFLGDDKGHDVAALRHEELTEVEKLSKAADESWLEDLLKDDAPKAAPAPAPESQRDLPALSSYQTTGTSHSSDKDDDLLSYLSKSGATTRDVSGIHPITRNSPRPSVHPEPVPEHRRVVVNTHRTPWGYFLGWGLLSLLMFVLLIGQYVYFNFDRLASEPGSYEKMRQLCQAAGCKVPLIEADKLKVRRVTVQRHPDNVRATRFNFILTNTADESQPLPAIRVEQKRGSKIIAGRLVQPVEYLPEDQANINRIPAHANFYVHIDIAKPRSELAGVSFTPSFH